MEWTEISLDPDFCLRPILKLKSLSKSFPTKFIFSVIRFLKHNFAVLSSLLGYLGKDRAGQIHKL